MTVDDLEVLGKIVGAVVALLGAIKLLPRLKKIATVFKDYALAPFRISKIMLELQPNGGSSLRDSINRIENSQTALAQKLAYSIDQNGCGFFSTNGAGDCVEVSPGYCRLVGKGDAESLGKRWIFNIHIKDRLRVIQEWKDAVTNMATFQSNYSMIDSDGNEVPVNCHATPVKDAKNNVMGYFGIVEPI